MDYQAIQTLIDKIDKKHLASILKRCYAHNKGFRIPGFANIQKVPPKVLMNNIKSRRMIAQDFLCATALEFASNEEIPEEDSLDEFLEHVSDSNKLGIIAMLLYREEEEYDALAVELLSEYDPSKAEPLEEISQTAEPDSPTRETEKYQKLRAKYFECKKERDELRLTVKEQEKTLEKTKTLADSLQQELDGAKQTIQTQSQALSERDEKIMSLRREVDILKSRERKLEKQQKKKIDAVVLALGCEKMLDRYRKRLDIEFSLPNDEEPETIFARYTEIWVAPGVPFATRRLMERYKASYKNLYFFRTVPELLLHVNKFCKQ